MMAEDELRRRAAGIELLALDVDGVWTDGSLYYGQDGEAFKRFDVKDGHGLVLWRDLGLQTAILTARTSGMVAVRAQELRIPFVFQGERDKAKGFEKLLALAGLRPEQVAYVGDDVNDIPVLAQVGFAAMPADGRPEVRPFVHHVCESAGGHGVIREICELLIKAKGRWDEALEKYVPALHP